MNASEFRKAYDKLYMPLGMYALRMCEDIDTAEDIVQTAFMDVWGHIQQGKRIASLKSYMYMAVRNSALSRMRTAGRDEEISGDGLPDVPEDDIDTSERDARLWQAIDKLPARRRQIFLMSKRDGMTYAEIAAELALSVKTVENSISKALVTLRADSTIRSIPVVFLPFL